MELKLLQKYISGDATKSEEKIVTEWIKNSPDNMREYMAQRKLHDISLWRTESVREKYNIDAEMRYPLRRIISRAVNIAAIFAIIIFSIHFWFSKNETNTVEDSLQSIYVPAGQRAELILADGTKVCLNSRSKLTFPGKFKDDIRNVRLDGEGYFEVTKNAERPFIVETNKYNIKVLGTEFNVTAYSKDSIWETSLVEGLVEIIVPGSANDRMRLEPNTMASLKGNKLIKAGIKESDYFLWREGLLCFNDISVRDMIEKLKLYYGVDIVVNNKKILNNRYTGKFRTKDGIEHVLKVLRLNNKFSYTKNDESNIITIN